VPPVGLRPPFVTPAAAHSHPDCRGILILIVAPQLDHFASELPAHAPLMLQKKLDMEDLLD
jgi:hypothetical protein